MIAHDLSLKGKPRTTGYSVTPTNAEAHAAETARIRSADGEGGAPCDAKKAPRRNGSENLKFSVPRLGRKLRRPDCLHRLSRTDDRRRTASRRAHWPMQTGKSSTRAFCHRRIQPVFGPAPSLALPRLWPCPVFGPAPSLPFHSELTAAPCASISNSARVLRARLVHARGQAREGSKRVSI